MQAAKYDAILIFIFFLIIYVGLYFKHFDHTVSRLENKQAYIAGLFVGTKICLY